MWSTSIVCVAKTPVCWNEDEMFPGKDITDGWYQQLETTIWVQEVAVWRKKGSTLVLASCIFVRNMPVVHKSTEWGVLQQVVERFILQSWIDLKK